MYNGKRTLTGKLFLLYLLTVFGKLSQAQSLETGTFNSNSLQYALNKKWSLFAESELRSLSFFHRFYYYEIKLGATYQYTPSLSFSLGNGIYNTYHGGVDYDGLKTSLEYRVWQQALFKHNIDVAAFEHRLRIEEVVQDDFRMNFRYRLSGKLGLNNKEIKKNTLFVSVFDEVFFRTQQPLFSRNRFQAGLGYVFSPSVTGQLGYMRQHDYAASRDFGKNYLYYTFQLKF